jgi:hypothetical protein
MPFIGICTSVTGPLRPLKSRVVELLPRVGFAWLLVCSVLFSQPVACGQPSTAIVKHNPAKLETITLPVGPEGFLTDSLSVPPGIYSVVILNQTGARDKVHFSVDKMANPDVSLGAVVESKVSDRLSSPAASNRIVQNVRLLAGTYRVSILEKPQWACIIQVK